MSQQPETTEQQWAQWIIQAFGPNRDRMRAANEALSEAFRRRYRTSEEIASFIHSYVSQRYPERKKNYRERSRVSGVIGMLMILV